MRLPRVDLEAVLTFVGDVSGLEFEEPYPVEVLARLRSLVRCDAITYQDCDLHAESFVTAIGLGPDDDGGEDDGDDDELYWSVGPCPISDYRSQTGDVRTVTMSDVIDRRRYHELPIFREYFAPAGVDHVIDLALPAGLRHHRSFVLFREAAGRDFTQRDRTVLDLIRPHLCHLEAHAALRRQLSEARALDGEAAPPDLYAELTPRQREILELVAGGRTNVEIASQLWVAPSTVKKHLEHIYAKLGVGRRTAAAALLRTGR